ncbi:hypothetical protein ASZ90_014905 [hydrocarbon metagenome]|uniref:Uncharacterized protein n=1 Tax=hydrocarbon metagenome TaxID=938273 RepID=A0A0W8F4E0_9ZZZZ
MIGSYFIPSRSHRPVRKEGGICPVPYKAILASGVATKDTWSP